MLGLDETRGEYNRDANNFYCNNKISQLLLPMIPSNKNGFYTICLIEYNGNTSTMQNQLCNFDTKYFIGNIGKRLCIYIDGQKGIQLQQTKYIYFFLHAYLCLDCLADTYRKTAQTYGILSVHILCLTVCLMLSLLLLLHC